MPSKNWFSSLWPKKEKDDDDLTRRDSTYEEVRRKPLKANSSHSIPLSTTTSRHPSVQRTQTTVKLRKIGSDGRRVFVNLPLPKYSLNHKGHPEKKYASNKIRTSKYTTLSFVPKNLFEQFRRPANLYFLGMAIIQLLPTFGVKSPVLTLLPICAVVIITALKDAFEDFQRHKVDEQYNQNITHTLIGYENPNYADANALTGNGLFSNCFGRKKQRNNSDATSEDKQQVNTIDDASTASHPVREKGADVFSKSLSRDIRVGDFILLRNGDSLPADAVLISSSDKEGVCFVETKDLDGETNLKPRNSIAELKHIQSGADCLNDCHFYVEAGAPSADLYKFTGTLVTLERNSNKWTEQSKTPIEIDNILLRGHVVRNTKWAIAVVLFTGLDTKIMLNSGETPSKRSQVDKEMNREVSRGRYRFAWVIDLYIYSRFLLHSVSCLFFVWHALSWLVSIEVMRYEQVIRVCIRLKQIIQLMQVFSISSPV